MPAPGIILARLVLALRRRVAQSSTVPIGIPLSAVLLLYAWRKLHRASPDLINWCGDFRANPYSVHYPETEGDLSAILADARRKNACVKVGGGLHSWSDIAMPRKEGVTYFIVLDRFNRFLRLDESARTVTVEVRT